MIKLFTDHHFHIGQAHLNGGKPCQDYAFSKAQEGLAYAIVSDGCSTGGDTDFGARLITRAAASTIHDHWAARKYILGETVTQNISLRQHVLFSGARDILRLEFKDLLATCMYAYITPKGGIVHLVGDGAIAIKYRSGKVKLFRYDWANNTPLYPAYREDSFESFIKAHSGDIKSNVLTEEIWIATPDYGLIPFATQEYTLDTALQGSTLFFTPEDLSTEIDFIAIFSDGATQVDKMVWKDAVSQLIAFKNTAGGFAKRRMKKFVKESHKIGRGPIDDIAYAVVRIEEENATTE